MIPRMTYIHTCDNGIMQNLRCRFAFCSARNYFALALMSPPAQHCHFFKCYTMEAAHRKKIIYSYLSCTHVTQHKRTGAVIVCWCVHSKHTTVCFQISNFLWVSKYLWHPLCLGMLSMSKSVILCSPPLDILNTKIPTSFHFFLSSVLILAPPHRQKITGAEREPSPSPPPPPVWKGRAGK